MEAIYIVTEWDTFSSRAHLQRVTWEAARSVFLHELPQKVLRFDVHALAASDTVVDWVAVHYLGLVPNSEGRVNLAEVNSVFTDGEALKQHIAERKARRLSTCRGVEGSGSAQRLTSLPSLPNLSKASAKSPSGGYATGVNPAAEFSEEERCRQLIDTTHNVLGMLGRPCPGPGVRRVRKAGSSARCRGVKGTRWASAPRVAACKAFCEATTSDPAPESGINTPGLTTVPQAEAQSMGKMARHPKSRHLIRAQGADTPPVAASGAGSVPTAGAEMCRDSAARKRLQRPASAPTRFSMRTATEPAGRRVSLRTRESVAEVRVVAKVAAQDAQSPPQPLLTVSAVTYANKTCGTLFQWCVSQLLYVGYIRQNGFQGALEVEQWQQQMEEVEAALEEQTVQCTTLFQERVVLGLQWGSQLESEVYRYTHFFYATFFYSSLEVVAFTKLGRGGQSKACRATPHHILLVHKLQ